jgi:hypothetical protein
LAETQTEGREGRKERDEKRFFEKTLFSFPLQLGGLVGVSRLIATAQISRKRRKSRKDSETEPDMGIIYS